CSLLWCVARWPAGTTADQVWYVPSVFFFQAEDGIRDSSVTGVQTCALPISSSNAAPWLGSCTRARATAQRCCSPPDSSAGRCVKIGRASCRERVEVTVDAGPDEKGTSRMAQRRRERHESLLAWQSDVVGSLW